MILACVRSTVFSKTGHSSIFLSLYQEVGASETWRLNPLWISRWTEHSRGEAVTSKNSDSFTLELFGVLSWPTWSCNAIQKPRQAHSKTPRKDLEAKDETEKKVLEHSPVSPGPCLFPLDWPQTWSEDSLMRKWGASFSSTPDWSDDCYSEPLHFGAIAT